MCRSTVDMSLPADQIDPIDPIDQTNQIANWKEFLVGALTALDLIDKRISKTEVSL